MIKITRPLRFAFFLILTLALLCSFFVLIIFKFWWDSNTILSLGGSFEVKEGMSANEIWTGLSRQGLIGSTWPWRYYAWRHDVENKLKPGTYQILEGERVIQVIERLVSGDSSSRELTITYPEGFTLDQIAERTAANGIGDVKSFRESAVPAVLVEQFSFLRDIPAGRDLEGYLFPDTYRLFVNDVPADVIKRMVTNFQLKFTEELIREAAAVGRTTDQVIIMASIIEREVIRDEDMAVVSGVLWKRFDEGAGLDADATVRYALNKWDGALTVDDLASDSPYNTRKWRGLPPGPISNPGLRAIVAAVRPQESEYYYYLSAPSGETIFSKDLDEHNVNKGKYLR